MCKKQEKEKQKQRKSYKVDRMGYRDGMSGGGHSFEAAFRRSLWRFLFKSDCEGRAGGRKAVDGYDTRASGKTGGNV